MDKIKVLIVCSGNFNYLSPFIKEQTNSLIALDVNIEFFFIKGKGALGYLKNLPLLKRKIKTFQPDLIHAHYGLSGMLAVLQRQIPVITTFHGCDVYSKKSNYYLSKIVERLSVYNIFVLDLLVKILKPTNKNYSIISCGIDIEKNIYIEKNEARNQLNLDKNKKYALFSGNYSDDRKNYTLAKQSIDIVENIELIELKGYNREQVNLLMNAVDFIINTSKRETGPLVVKEAMACGCPIVTVDIGDVREVIGNTEGCCITSYDPNDIADKIKKVLIKNRRINGRQRIIELELDNDMVAAKILKIYKNIINKSK